MTRHSSVKKSKRARSDGFEQASQATCTKGLPRLVKFEILIVLSTHVVQCHQPYCVNPISTGLFISLKHWGGGGEVSIPLPLKFDPDILKH